jgi:hypothetical protein
MISEIVGSSFSFTSSGGERGDVGVGKGWLRFSAAIALATRSSLARDPRQWLDGGCAAMLWSSRNISQDKPVNL